VAIVGVMVLARRLSAVDTDSRLSSTEAAESDRQLEESGVA
jgi:hypothetical protein